MSLILAPCRARGLATVVRRILVILPESSLHAHRAVLVFARAKMCGRLSRFSGTILSMGRCDSVHVDLRPCEGLDSLQSKEISVGWSLVNVNFHIRPTIFCNSGKQ